MQNISGEHAPRPPRLRPPPPLFGPPPPPPPPLPPNNNLLPTALILEEYITEALNFPVPYRCRLH